jgi:hypothetical protein
MTKCGCPEHWTGCPYPATHHLVLRYAAPARVLVDNGSLQEFDACQNCTQLWLNNPAEVSSCQPLEEGPT